MAVHHGNNWMCEMKVYKWVKKKLKGEQMSVTDDMQSISHHRIICAEVKRLTNQHIKCN
jgi:hypothetical protein